MGRPRKPTEVLEMNGAFDKNPNRRNARLNEPHVDKGIGNPPHSFTATQKRIWRELSKNIPWLKVTDRLSFEMVCRLTAVMRNSPETFSGTQTSALTALVRTLGLTPSDRSRVNAPQQEKEDEWTALLNGSSQQQAEPASTPQERNEPIVS